MMHLRLRWAVLALVMTLAACGSRAIGYGVVLWPTPDNPLETGQVVTIVDRSDLQGTTDVRVTDTRMTVQEWRIATFESREAAEAFAAEYEPWYGTFARSLRTALPIRETPDRTSTRVYRMRDGEVVKVLGRTADESDEAGLVGHWYRVLTEEGTVGWVFGYHLELTGSGVAVQPEAPEQDRVERLVRDIATQIWRPEYFLTMIETGRIDLSRFDTRYGLFGDAEAQRFRIVLPGIDRTFDYTGFFSPSTNVVEFEGTNLILNLRGTNQLVAQYRIADRERSTIFVLLDQDIELLIAAERERRSRLLDEIWSRGEALASTAYGTIELLERGAIRWEGFDRLVPAVLPADFDGNAGLAANLFIGDELRGRYDGALSMLFPGNRSVAFLYRFTDDGLRLVYVPADQIEDRVIEEEPLSPIVMFYRFVAG